MFRVRRKEKLPERALRIPLFRVVSEVSTSFSLAVRLSFSFCSENFFFFLSRSTLSYLVSQLHHPFSSYPGLRHVLDDPAVNCDSSLVVGATLLSFVATSDVQHVLEVKIGINKVEFILSKL